MQYCVSLNYNIIKLADKNEIGYSWLKPTPISNEYTLRHDINLSNTN